MALPAGEGERWTGEARALLATAIDRHGGWEAWKALRVLIVKPRALSGLLPWLKGHGRTFGLPSRAEVRPHDAKATFFDYPTKDATGTFAAGAITLTDASGASVLSLADARAQYRGVRKLRRWSAADALYFFGYALTHYHSLPFSLARGEPRRLVRIRSGGRALAGVEVELPADLHTHCRRQTFYFDQEGLLRRHDYVAEIAGGWARGAHFWRDFVTVGGIQMATVRHVVARLGRAATPFVALHAELSLSEPPG
jgi:hypothetical protein